MNEDVLGRCADLIEKLQELCDEDGTHLAHDKTVTFSVYDLQWQRWEADITYWPVSEDGDREYRVMTWRGPFDE